MKIEISRRNFLLSVSAAAAFAPQLAKRAMIAEDEIIQSLSHANGAKILATDGRVLSSVDWPTWQVKLSPSNLTFELPYFEVTESGIAEKIVIYKDNEVLFSIQLKHQYGLVISMRAFIDDIHVGA